MAFQRNTLYKYSLNELLQTEMFLRRCSVDDLARGTKMSSRQIREELNGKRKAVTWQFCEAVAQAWGMPIEEVLRKAGLFPQSTPLIRQIGQVVKTLNQKDQETLISVLPSSFPTEPFPVTPREGFTQWLSWQMDMRLWDWTTFAQQVGISESALESLMTSDKTTERWFCMKIADALNIPPTEVFYAAGLLPLTYRNTARRLIDRLFLVEETSQRFVLRLAQALAKTSQSVP